MFEPDYWMSLVIFLPTLFALVLLLFPRGSEEYVRWWSLLGTALTLLVSMFMFIDYLYVLDRPSDRKEIYTKTTLAYRVDKQSFREEVTHEPRQTDDLVSCNPWIRRFNIDYFLGVDGISMAMVLLTTIICFLSMIASWNIEKHVKGYCALFLLLETGILGTFLALDFFLFYIFWEVMLLPMYFLIGVWGGPRREYAAIKFFLYTLLGSVFILIALLAFYFTNVRDFVSNERLVAAASPHSVKEYEQARADWAKKQKEVEEMEKAVGEIQTLEKNIADEKDADKKKKLEKEFVAKNQAWEKAQPAYLKARLARDNAKIMAEKELSKVPVSIHTFDIILLHKVGRAGLQYFSPASGKPDIRRVEAVQLEQARNTLKSAQETAQLSKNLLGDPAELDKKIRQEKDPSKKKKLQKESGPVDAAHQNEVEARNNLNLLQVEMSNRLSSSFFNKNFHYIMFLLLFIGFAIKVPLFPFHTWLPDAHVEAPTPISMILAGILLKLGGYGILRIAYPICPVAARDLAWFLALFGIINIVYGAFAAMAQTDFKKLVAYSSISHMGYVILGIAVWPLTAANAQYWSWGMNGAMYQMLAHGISSAGMFFLVGVIYDRAHHRNLDNFRGLYEPMPFYGGVSAIIFFAALGLPGLCGFVGEFYVILSTFQFGTEEMKHIGIVFAILAALTVVITASYILWTLQRVYFGTNPAYKNYSDMGSREILCIFPLVVLAVLLGVLPQVVLFWMEPHVTALVDSLMILTR